MIVTRLAAARQSPSWYHLGRACRLLSGAGAGGDDTQQVKVFDRAAKRSQRDRAAAADWNGEFDYLREHIASALVDRIEASTEKPSPPSPAPPKAFSALHSSLVGEFSRLRVPVSRIRVRIRIRSYRI